MQFMMLVKSKEGLGQPPQELIEAINEMSQRASEESRMLGGGGLAPTAASTRVRISAGTVQRIDGPFMETKEVVGGYAIMQFPTREAAIENALEFMELHRKYWPGWEGETEIRQIFTPEDYEFNCGKMKLKQEVAG